MTQAERAALERECVTFAAYVSGTRPCGFVVSRYVAAHELGRVDRPGRDSALDALLLRRASRGGFRTATADTYARMFRPGGLLRRKLVLVAALLESSAPSYSAFESPAPSSRVRVVARLALIGLRFALLQACAVALIAPAHLFLRLSGRSHAHDAATLPAPS